MTKRLADQSSTCNKPWISKARRDAWLDRFDTSPLRIVGPKTTSKMDDLVVAAIDYADGALAIAEELLDGWYEASSEEVATRSKSPLQYEAEMKRLSIQKDKYKERLMKLRER